MRLDKFWEFVKENPWFLRLFSVGHHVRNVRDDDRMNEEMESLAVYLTTTLPECVDWIAPRPWNTEVLKMKTSRNMDGSTSFIEECVPGKHTIRTATEFVIFWHREGWRPFTVSQEVPGDLCPQDVIDGIKANFRMQDRVFIDVVVRIHDKHTTPWRHRSAIHSQAFELYFRRKKSKLGVPDSRGSHISNLGF